MSPSTGTVGGPRARGDATGARGDTTGARGDTTGARGLVSAV